MSLFQIKICGITNSADLITAVDAGADAVGLNFYAPSVRSVSLDRAGLLLTALRKHSADQADSTAAPKMVGVFVNHSAAEIAGTVEQLGLDIVQLHGDEQPRIIEEVHVWLATHDLERQPAFIRAIRIQKDLQLKLGSEAAENALREEAAAWQSAGAAMVLLDAAVPGSFGGTGHCLDWNAVKQANLPIPVVLAGGLTPENVAQSITTAAPNAVDVASGVENAEHRKDAQLIHEFVTNATRAFEKLG